MSQLHTEIETWLDTVDPADLHDASDLRTIALAHDARPYGEEPVLAAVAAARLAGRTWAEIGLALGMSRQSAHSRFAARLDQAMMVRVQAALVERKGRQVIEAELKTEHVPSDALFSMRISRQPFGFGHSRTGSMATGDLPRFDFPDSWHGTQELKSGRYKVEGEIRLGGTIIHDAAYVDVE